MIRTLLLAAALAVLTSFALPAFAQARRSRS